MANRTPERKTQFLLSSPSDGAADYILDCAVLILHNLLLCNTLHCVNGVDSVSTTCGLTRVIHASPQSFGPFEGVRNMFHEHPFAGHQHSHHIELIRLSFAAVAVDPDLR